MTVSCGKSLKDRERNVVFILRNKYAAMKEWFVEKLPLLVLIYCILQPLMDVATYWQEHLHTANTLTVVLRMGLLCGSVLLGFILSDRKRYYWLMALVLGGFLAGHVWACTQAGYLQPFGDLSNMVRIYLMPLTALCFCTFLRRNDKVLPAFQMGIVVNFCIIIVVMLLSRLTGTDPYTYPNKALGVRGWFYFANTQSAILAMIVPIALGWTLKKWETKLLPVAIMTALGFGSLFVLGTRLAYASLAAVGLGLPVCLLLIDRKRWRQSVVIGVITVVFAVMLPVSPMMRNQKAVAGNFDIKQTVFDEAAKTEEDASPQQEHDALVNAYRLFLPGMISRFGEERTLQAYQYSHDVDKVGNQRLMRLTFCKLLMEDAPESAKWFGLNRSWMGEKAVHTDVLTGKTKEMVTWYDPENDFHAIYYLCGMVGLTLMIAFIGYFAVNALLAMTVDFRGKFTIEFAAMALSCCCAVAHCYFTASILRFNSASVYLAMILAAMWYLSRRKTAENAGK